MPHIKNILKYDGLKNRMPGFNSTVLWLYSAKNNEKRPKKASSKRDFWRVEYIIIKLKSELLYTLLRGREVVNGSQENQMKQGHGSFCPLNPRTKFLAFPGQFTWMTRVAWVEQGKRAAPLSEMPVYCPGTAR